MKKLRIIIQYLHLALFILVCPCIMAESVETRRGNWLMMIPTFVYFWKELQMKSLEYGFAKSIPPVKIMFGLMVWKTQLKKLLMNIIMQPQGQNSLNWLVKCCNKHSKSHEWTATTNCCISNHRHSNVSAILLKKDFFLD